VARRALVAAGLLALALSACGGGSSSDDDSGPSRPAALLGVTAGVLTEAGAPVQSEVRTMAATGVTTLRAPFYWSHIETTKGKPSFAAIDPLVAATAREHIELLPIVLGAPSWAALHPKLGNSPPADPATYAAFLKVLIARYGPDGSFWDNHPDLPKQPIRAWQIWNEPNHNRYWSDQPYAARYVALARAARKAIKAADPEAVVVAAGFADRSWESITQIYRAGAKGVFDVIAIHPYTYEVGNVLRIVRYARRSLRQAGDGSRPMWLTEVTWSSGKRPGHQPYPFETTPADQAARLSEALPLLIAQRKALGVQRIFWENWISRDSNHANPFDFSGLRVLHPDGGVTSKPAYFAFKKVALAQR
jgi:polysaccharide biosynthesis protein PslG